MSLVLFLNFDHLRGDYVCGANMIATKFLPSGSNFKKRDYTGSRCTAIVPPSIVCRQGLEAYFDTDELVDYKKVTD